MGNHSNPTWNVFKQMLLLSVHSSNSPTHAMHLIFLFVFTSLVCASQETNSFLSFDYQRVSNSVKNGRGKSDRWIFWPHLQHFPVRATKHRNYSQLHYLKPSNVQSNPIYLKSKKNKSVTIPGTKLEKVRCLQCLQKSTRPLDRNTLRSCFL